jgi:hypothetical protein
LVSASTDKRNPVIRSHNSSPQVAAAA